VGAHSLGQDEQYLTVREILSEASTLVPPQAGLSRERSDFYRFGYATLGFSPILRKSYILGLRNEALSARISQLSPAYVPRRQTCWSSDAIRSPGRLERQWTYLKIKIAP
jgi:hypothetical protein